MDNPILKTFSCYFHFEAKEKSAKVINTIYRFYIYRNLICRFKWYRSSYTVSREMLKSHRIAMLNVFLWTTDALLKSLLFSFPYWIGCSCFPNELMVWIWAFEEWAHVFWVQSANLFVAHISKSSPNRILCDFLFSLLFVMHNEVKKDEEEKNVAWIIRRQTMCSLYQHSVKYEHEWKSNKITKPKTHLNQLTEQMKAGNWMTRNIIVHSASTKLKIDIMHIIRPCSFSLTKERKKGNLLQNKITGNQKCGDRWIFDIQFNRAGFVNSISTVWYTHTKKCNFIHLLLFVLVSTIFIINVHATHNAGRTKKSYFYDARDK